MWGVQVDLGYSSTSTTKSVRRSLLLTAIVLCLFAWLGASSALAGSITGTVTDEATEDPIEGVCVDVMGPGFGSATTGSDGRYSVEGFPPDGLPSGNYTLQFTGCGASSNYLSEYYDDKQDLFSADQVSVTQGAETSGRDAALEEGGSISGTVTEDGSGAPLQGICVNAYDASGGGGFPGPAPAFGSANTDVNGDYTVAGLPSGSYKLEFSPCGFGATHLREYYDDKPDLASADAVSVTAGSDASNKNAALAEGGSISGTVTEDGSGAPLASVCVSAYDADAPGPMPPSVKSASTDFNGDYMLSGLPAGDYKVQFGGPCGPGSNHLSEYFDDQPDLASANTISVVAGQETAEKNAALSKAGSISGTVTDEGTGAPLQGICVNAREASGGELSSSGFANTDLNGAYTINGLSTGNHKVEFIPCGPGSHAGEYYDDKPDFASADAVPVTAGQDTPGTDAALAQKGSISGSVTEEGTGDAVSGACVSIYDSDDPSPFPGMPPSAVATAAPDANGDYTAPVPPGDGYKVWFHGCEEGFNHAAEYYQDKATLETADAVSVQSGTDTAGIDGELAKAGSISGTITEDGTGNPLADGCATAIDATDMPVAMGKADANGDYTIRGLGTGDYRIQFRVCEDFPTGNGPTHVTEYYDDKLDPNSADEVSVTLGVDTPNKNAALARTGSISGTVTAEGSGAPLQGILVTAQTEDGFGGSLPVQTDANGNYTVTGLPSGSFLVEFRDEGSKSYVAEYYDDAADQQSATPVEVTSGQDSGNTDAELALGGTFSGTVTDESSQPLPFVGVTAYDGNGTIVATASTDFSGNYKVGALPAGSYKAEFRDSGFSGEAKGREFYDDRQDLDTADEITVSVGADASGKNAALGAGSSISGTVTDEANGNPAQNVCVEVFDASGISAGFTLTDTNGAYLVHGLGSGDHFVEFGDCPLPFGSSQFEPEFYDDKADLASANAVPVAAGTGVTGIDAALAATGGGDTTPPDTTIDSGPANGSTTADNTPTFEFSSPDGDLDHFECQVDGGPWVFCASPQATPELTDGEHTVAVRAVDTSGNADPEPATRTFTVDATAPDVSIDEGPLEGSTIGNASPAFEFSSSAGDVDHFECKVDGGAFSNCTSPKTLAELSDGEHTFSVKAVDGAGNESAPASRTFTVDTAGPGLSIDSGPDGPTNDEQPGFGFTADAGSTLTCSIDQGTPDFGACDSDSAHAPAGPLADGGYTFRVRAADAVGNETTRTREFTVDTAAPETSIVSGPAGTTKKRNPSFALGSSEGNSTFECQLDGGGFEACNSPKSLSELADGEHTFDVRATDAAGNQDGTAASRTWTIDNAATTETTSGSAPAGGTVSSDPEGTEPDEETPVKTAITTPSGGEVTIETKQTTTQTPPSGFEIFGQEVEITADPATVEEPLALTFVLDASVIPPGTNIDLVTVFRDGQPAGDCEGGSQAVPDPCIAERNLLPSGDLEITALSSHASAWNLGTAPDTTAPETAIDSGPAEGATIDDPTPTFEFSGSPGSDVDHLECRVDGGQFSNCTSPKTLAALADGEHTFRVRAVDAAGNADQSPATRTFTVDTSTDEPPAGDPPADDPPAGDPPAGDDSDNESCEQAQADQRKAKKALKKAKKKQRKANKKKRKAKKKARNSDSRKAAKKLKKATKKAKKAKRKAKRAKKGFKQAKKAKKKACKG